MTDDGGQKDNVLPPATRGCHLPPEMTLGFAIDSALCHRFSHRCLISPSTHGRDAVAPLPQTPANHPVSGLPLLAGIPNR